MTNKGLIIQDFCVAAAALNINIEGLSINESQEKIKIAAAIQSMQPTQEQYNERGTRIMQLEMALENLKLECAARGLYNMAETIDEVLCNN